MFHMEHLGQTSSQLTLSDFFDQEVEEIHSPLRLIISEHRINSQQSCWFFSELMQTQISCQEVRWMMFRNEMHL